LTRRDLFWRGLGGVLVIVAPTAELLVQGDTGGPQGLLTLLLLAATFFGLLLLIQGRKVALVLRIEGSRHRALPELIHSRRRARSTRRPR